MRKPALIIVIGLLVTFAATSSVSADVLRAAPGGVTVRTTVDVAGTPDSVYDALTARIGEWWGAASTWSGNPRNLSIDARAGGCFCEKLSTGGTVQHMQVVWAERGSLLRLTGAPGQLQELAVIATLSWQLTKVDAGTRIQMTFSASGYLPAGFDQAAKAVDDAWAGQVRNLERYLAKP